MSVKCKPPILVTISSSPSPLSGKFRSMSVHRSVKKLEFYRTFSRLLPISYTRGILGRALGLCPCNAHCHCWSLSVKCTPPTLVSNSFSLSPLCDKLCSMNVHQFAQKLEFYRTISRLVPISSARGILGRTVGLCSSNTHPQLWY